MKRKSSTIYTPSKRSYGNKTTKRAKRNTKKLTQANKQVYRLVSPFYSFPLQYQNKMRYAEVFTLNASLGASVSYAFRTNSLYDPNYTGVGYQPLYYAQLIGIYNHWTVISSSIRVTITGNQQVRGVLYIDDDTSFAGNVDAATSRPGAMVKWDNLAYSGPMKLSAGWNAARTFPGDPMGNTDLQGAATSNPTEESYYVMYFDAPDGTSATIYGQVEIIFNVVWDELKTVTAT